MSQKIPPRVREQAANFCSAMGAVSKDVAFAELVTWISQFDLKRREVERLGQIKRDYANSEHICSCGLRVDDTHPKGDF